METLDGYLEALASTSAVPGGGSASALVASLGVALVAMVAHIAAANPRNAGAAAPLLAIATRADELRSALRDARHRDETAFSAVGRAQSLPKGNEREKALRRTALGAALEAAAEAPLHAAELSVCALELAAQLLEYPTGALRSDIDCAKEFASAAVAGCAHNVRVNHRSMRDAAAIARQEERLSSLEARARLS